MIHWKHVWLGQQGCGCRNGQEPDHRALWVMVRSVDLNLRAVGGHGRV